MSDIYLAVSETPTVVTLTSAVIASSASSTVTVSSLPAISGTVTANLFAYDAPNDQARKLQISDDGIGLIVAGSTNENDNPVIISGTVTASLSAGTNRIGVVTIGGGTVTIGAGTAQIGSVTASNLLSTFAAYSSGNSDISVNIKTVAGQVLGGGTYVPVEIREPIPAGTNLIGTVTANLSISSTAITSGSFSSLTSATLVPANTARKMATVYNLGPGQLFVNAGASATTLGGGFMVALSSSDYLECDFTTTTLSALYATAGTASWVSH